MKGTEIVERCKIYTEDVLNELSVKIRCINELKKNNDTCVFASGAFGRYEANPNSGIDLFVIATDSRSLSTVPNLTESIITDLMINVINEMGILGEVCEPIYLEDLVNDLYTQNEVPSIAFKVKMLLLLESTVLYNEDFYNEAIGKIFLAYGNNFNGDKKISLLTHLINDIMIYLNATYTHYNISWNSISRLNKGNFWVYLKDLKLFYSRNLACYSFIIQMLLQHKELSSEALLRIVKMKPIDRLINIKSIRPKLSSNLDELVSLYSWSMDICNHLEDSHIQDIYNFTITELNFTKRKNIFLQKTSEIVLTLIKEVPNFQTVFRSSFLHQIDPRI